MVPVWRERMKCTGQKAPSAIRCIKTCGPWPASTRAGTPVRKQLSLYGALRQVCCELSVGAVGGGLRLVLDGLVKPRPPLLRVNRRILVFFFRRGWSGFHAMPDMRWRGWSGFHAAPDRRWRGWSGFHATPEKVQLRGAEFPSVWGVVPAVFSGLVFLLRCRCC